MLIGVSMALLVSERLIWLYCIIGILLTAIPARIQRKRTFAQAKQVIENADPSITKIGIAGSFGKSSTKEILYHLLTSEYGTENVLYNPANENHELAIARLIIKNKDFFSPLDPPSESNTPHLVILSGPIGTGKSTIAKGMAEEWGYEHICFDSVKQELFGEKSVHGDKQKHAQLYTECLTRAEALINEGKNVVTDYVIVKNGLKRIEDFCEAKDLNPDIKILFTDRETTIQRDSERDLSFGAEYVTEIWNEFADLKKEKQYQDLFIDTEGKSIKETLKSLYTTYHTPNPKIFLFETGAYRRGEIQQIAETVKPEIGILTGLSQQHIELFGSQRNIQLAKFELAENCTKKVFFNHDNALTAEIFGEKEIEAVKIPISQTAAEDIQAQEDSTSFKAYGETFTLPWPGKFFVQNTLLCLETARELGISPKSLATYLPKLPVQKRALHSVTRKLGNSDTLTVLYDLYSQNPDGTLKAIEHFGKSEGNKLFIGMPLLELGSESKQIHEQIFSSLKKVDATVFWLKPDFHALGSKILGEKFVLLNPRKPKEIERLAMDIQNLSTPTTILLEGRIPQNILDIFKTQE